MKFVRFISLTLFLLTCNGSLFAEVASPKIIGGVAADNGEHDYFVSLMFPISWNGGEGWITRCAGGYIGGRKVVTAAHCVEDITQFSDLRVLVGNYSQTDMKYLFCISGGSTCSIYDTREDIPPFFGYTYVTYVGSEHPNTLISIPYENINTHPWYNSNTFDYDIALIELPIDVSNSYLSLPQSDIFSLKAGSSVDNKVQAVGHGITEYSIPSAQLLEIELTARTDSQCEESPLGILFNRSNMICAGDLNKDTGQGDSGGPLIDQSTSTLLGITSWGLQSCQGASDCYGVYTDVYRFTSWIESDGIFVVPIVEKNADGELLRMGRTAGAFGGLFGLLITLLFIRKRHEN